MTRRETTAIALKCFGIYIVCELITTIPLLVAIGHQINNTYYAESPSFLWAILLPVMSVILGLVCVVLLWKFANSLILQGPSEPIPDETCCDIDRSEVMKIVLACMGVYFFIDAVTAIPNTFVNLQITMKLEDYNISVNLTSLATQVLELLFGCLLIAKPEKLARKITAMGGK